MEAKRSVGSKVARLGLWAALVLAVAAWGGRAGAGGESGPMTSAAALMRELTLARVEIVGGFFGARRDQLRVVILPSQWENLEANHHVDNFRVLAGLKDGPQLGPVYIDSDLYKWTEAAAYVLAKHPDDRWLKGRLDELAGLFQKAQAPDGYLNTYYQFFAPERRFQNLWHDHELYCAGHLIEAACASYETTGDPRLLGVARAYANLIAETFGPGKNEGVPGHEEIELALVRLYRLTQDPRYLELADFFIRQRGTGPYLPGAWDDLGDKASLTKIVKRRRAELLGPGAPEARMASGLGAVSWVFTPGVAEYFFSGKYYQADQPLLKSTVAVGHSVRAMYFYSGAGDLYLEQGDPQILETLETIWRNTTEKRTYVTGGMGAVGTIEGFGPDYFLPHRSYAESCAGIGAFLFNWRLLKATGEAKYADQMEKTLYNAILPGLGLDGQSYFYVNTLIARGETQRSRWFGCACCPPNLARLLGSLERYIYAEDDAGVWVHQYISSEASFDRPNGRLVISQTSGLPWDGKVAITVKAAPPGPVALRLRVPAWAETYVIAINGERIETAALLGAYLELEREWQSGDRVELDFSMTPRLIFPDPRVAADRGHAAIARGPLIYCLEDRDNPGVDVHLVRLARDPALEAEARDDLLGGVVVVKARAAAGATLVAVPYYAWANRGPSQMEVWIRSR